MRKRNKALFIINLKILIVVIYSFLCNVEKCEIKLTVNHFFKLYSFPLTIKEKLKYTTREHIVSKRKIISNSSKPSHPYSKCAENLNENLDEKYGICNDSYLNDEPRYLNATHITLMNVVANSRGSWGIGNALITPPKEDYGRNYWFQVFELFNGTIDFDVDELILTGFGLAREIFGHMMADLLAPILLLPKETIERSYIIGSKLNYMNEYLKIMGFTQQQIIVLEDDQWVYVRKLHVFSEKRSISSYNGHCLELLHKYFEEHFKLFSIKATEYMLLNRVSKRGRVIDNFDDLVKTVKTTFHEKNWKKFYEVKDIKETAKKWASVRFIVQIDGSNCFNSIFMKKGTVLCIGSSTHMDFCSAFFIVATHHFVYWFAVPGVDHLNFKHGNLNIDYAIDAVRKCLFCDEHGYFQNS